MDNTKIAPNHNHHLRLVLWIVLVGWDHLFSHFRFLSNALHLAIIRRLAEDRWTRYWYRILNQFLSIFPPSNPFFFHYTEGFFFSLYLSIRLCHYKQSPISTIPWNNRCWTNKHRSENWLAFEVHTQFLARVWVCTNIFASKSVDIFCSSKIPYPSGYDNPMKVFFLLLFWLQIGMDSIYIVILLCSIPNSFGRKMRSWNSGTVWIWRKLSSHNKWKSQNTKLYTKSVSKIIFHSRVYSRCSVRVSSLTFNTFHWLSLVAFQSMLMCDSFESLLFQ